MKAARWKMRSEPDVFACIKSIPGCLLAYLATDLEILEMKASSRQDGLIGPAVE